MDFLSARAKKEAVAERWPLMEARLYNFKMVVNFIKLILSIKKKSVQGTIFFLFWKRVWMVLTDN